MPIHLYLAPAAAGKTDYVLHQVHQAARDLATIPRVVLPTQLQVRAWRRRLAQAGGALGVRLLTFDRLYAECLNAAGEIYTELSEPVQYRLIRAIVDNADLTHYAPLQARPGFIHVLQELVGELKAARIWPEQLAQAITELGDAPRLRELAQIYAAYQAQLQAQGWADRAGLGWLAVEALEERAPHVARDWPLLVVDGFDNLTEVQLALLQTLAGRVGTLLLTLTGEPDAQRPRPVHRRFYQTRQRLEYALGIQAEPLPQQVSHQAPALAHLEATLYRGDSAIVESADALELIAAPDRAAEARAALRWLKARLVKDGMRPGEVALLARDLSAYRPFILHTAAEFGLPVRLVNGLPLRANPAIAALLDLLRAVLPRAEEDPTAALSRRLVVEAWRSPYFDWSALPEAGATAPIDIGPGDADALDAVARWGQVIGGHEQWTKVLDALAAHERSSQDDADKERGLPPGLPVGPSAQALRNKFDRYLQRLTPPPGPRPYRDFVGWLEGLIGPDPDAQQDPLALNIVAQARAAQDPAIAERDIAALQTLKDVLRGLVWAQEALHSPPIDLTRFFQELVGAVDANAYRLPVQPGREEILVADVVQARGVPLRALAVLGLAEGEFPAPQGQDPFLPDADRARLREGFDLPLQPSTLSAEIEFFYETLTRPRERLLLTRPRLADNGAPWQASPFWEEVRRRVKVEPLRLSSEHRPTPAQAASWPELMESLSGLAQPSYTAVQTWVAEQAPERQAALNAATQVLNLRTHRAAGSPFEGDLQDLGALFARRFGPDRPWSASRLESYRACPFLFFVGSVLGLEPRGEPAEGLDARQLGNIYHRLLEALHQAPQVSDPADVEQLLGALEAVADPMLECAPKDEGFRATAWWAQTRAEILENVRRSLQALAEQPGDFAPYQHEAVFGLGGAPPLTIYDDDGRVSFCLRGLIDRVDRAPDGRLRVIDYKTGGPYAFTKKAVQKGKKLQLPLYALAAQEALALGEAVEGFYWHVQHAQPSSFTLGGFDGGPEEAMRLAIEKAWEAIRGARDGHFTPHLPDEGCPAYCPAAGFCWHYDPGFRR